MTSAPTPQRFRRRRLILAVVIWAALIGGLRLIAQRLDLSMAEAMMEVVHVCMLPVLGPLIFLAMFALAPFAMVPAALLGVVAGAAFGPVVGIALTLVGCNLSACVGYAMGRWSHQPQPAAGRLAQLRTWLCTNSFRAILVARLTFLPYDAVSFLAGSLHIRFGRFLAANTFGVLPGVALIVLGIGWLL